MRRHIVLLAASLVHLVSSHPIDIREHYDSKSPTYEHVSFARLNQSSFASVATHLNRPSNDLAPPIQTICFKQTKREESYDWARLLGLHHGQVVLKNLGVTSYETPRYNWSATKTARAYDSRDTSRPRSSKKKLRRARNGQKDGSRPNDSFLTTFVPLICLLAIVILSAFAAHHFSQKSRKSEEGIELSTLGLCQDDTNVLQYPDLAKTKDHTFNTFGYCGKSDSYKSFGGSSRESGEACSIRAGDVYSVPMWAY